MLFNYLEGSFITQEGISSCCALDLGCRLGNLHVVELMGNAYSMSDKQSQTLAKV